MNRWLKLAQMMLVLPLLMIPGLAEAESAAWASYTVTFEATWSAETHPTSFPANPHFSGLIGGTHNGAVDFWAEGALASTGIKQMAEWGSQPTLQAEVEAAITAGNAGEVIVGDVLWVSPGVVQTSFSIQPDFPLVSVVTMIAPSPDWFAGVAGLNLVVGGQWVTQLSVPLYPYDAGTDSGLNYTSGDLATIPADSIAAISGAPFSSGVPVGTLIFTLDAAAAVPELVSLLALRAQPNPFNPATELHFVLPENVRRAQMAIFDGRGRLVRRLSVVAVGGAQRTLWDGRSDGGIGVASGVYFVRLEVDGVGVVRKVALVE